MNFAFQHRGYGRPLVVLPGWAFDSRVFPLHEMCRDIVAPSAPLTGEVTPALLKFLTDNGITQVDILGWSLGAVCAVEFARMHENIVQNLILVSARANYPVEMVKDLVIQVSSDRIKALRRFYLTAFYGQSGDYRMFRKKHMPALLEIWSARALTDGLMFLMHHPILPYTFKETNLLMLHGSEDKVAPLEHMPSLSSRARLKKIILDGFGHLPFLSPRFHEFLEDF